MACGPGQSERINRNRFIQASQGINTCLPEDSGAQSISSGLLTTCTTGIQAAGVFALQTWKAICWLWSEIQAQVADITELQTTVAEQEAEIAALQAAAPPTHVGTPTISAGAAAGTGPTLTLLAGSDDTQGAVDVTLGTSPTAAGGSMFTIQFGTNFAAQIFPVVSARVGGALTAAGLLVNTFESGTAPVSACLIVVHSPTSAFLAGQTFRVSYRIGFTA